MEILNIGITAESGNFDFYINSKKDDWSSFTHNWNKTLWRQGTDIEKVTISCLPLDEVLSQKGSPYYLKIDIEGCDVDALRSLLNIDTSNLPQYLSVELPTYNNLPDKQVDYLEILCILRTLGYKKFQLVDQSQHHLVCCPNPPLEGKWVSYTFDGHCSGLFGQELPGPWETIDQVAHKYIKYIQNKNQGQKSTAVSRTFKKFLNQPGIDVTELNPNGWFDVHVTL